MKFWTEQHRIGIAALLAWVLLSAAARPEPEERPASQPQKAEGLRGTLLVTPPAAADSGFQSASSAGLFVGVRKFLDPDGKPSSTIGEVPFAVDDAVDLAYQFSIELGLLLPDRVTIAISGEPEKEETRAALAELEQAGARRTSATLSAILSEVARTSSRAADDGLLIVSFATHGFSSESVSSFLTQDSWLGNLSKTAITVHEVLAQIEHSRAKRRLVLVDACRERVSESRGLGDTATVARDLSATLGRADGMALLMATVSGGYSYDDYTQKNGVFTGALLNGLRGGAETDTQGFITVETLSRFASAAVGEWVRANRPEHADVSTGISVWYENIGAFEMPLAAVAASRTTVSTEKSPTHQTDIHPVWLRRDDGALYRRMAATPGARRHVLLFPPAVTPADSSGFSWLRSAIPFALEYELAQNPFITCVTSFEARFGDGLAQTAAAPWGADSSVAYLPPARLRQIAREERCQYYVTGRIDVADDGLVWHVELHDTRNGSIVKEHVQRGARALELIDETSAVMLASMDIPSDSNATDLPVTDLLTASDEALRLAAIGLESWVYQDDASRALASLDQATDVDETFAVAHVIKLLLLLTTGETSLLELTAQAVLDHEYRIPERYQLFARVLYFLVRGDPEKALDLAEMGMRLYEGDWEWLLTFAFIAAQTSHTQDATWAYEHALQIDPSQTELLLKLSELALKSGNIALAIRRAREYTDAAPQESHGYVALGDVYRASGEYEGADEAYARAELLEPASLTAKLARIDLRKHHSLLDEGRLLGGSYLKQATTASDSARILEAISDWTEYEGIYWDEDVATAYYCVRRLEGELVVERSGRFVGRIVGCGAPGKFQTEDGQVQFTFERGESGHVEAMRYVVTGRGTELQQRHVPDISGLRLSELITQIQDTHRLDRLPQLAGVRFVGKVEIPALAQQGRVEFIFDASRSRTQMDVGNDRVIWTTSGDRAFRKWFGQEKLEALDGVSRDLLLQSHPGVVFGDWRAKFPTMEFLRRADTAVGPRDLVHTVPDQGPGSTKAVDPDRGVVSADQRFELLEGKYLGVIAIYDDFRDVGGMLLPFRIVSHYNLPALGKIIVTYESAEITALPDSAFAVPADFDRTQTGRSQPSP